MVRSISRQRADALGFPPTLVAAGAGLAAYGWPVDVSDENILKNLLALNRERAEAQS